MNNIIKEKNKRICLQCNTVFEVLPHEIDRKYCTKSCANKRPCTEETKIKRSNALKGNIPSNKGKSTRVIKICPICNKEFLVYPTEHRTYCSKMCYNNDSNCKHRKVSKGGYRQGSGHGKHGWYRGIWCDSTYELCFLIYCLDHQIEISRNSTGYPYVVDNIQHNYYPDFIIDNALIEVKGFHTELVDIKLSTVNTPVIILYKKDLKFVFEYVNKNYTKNYQSLYDNYRPKYNYKCTHCNKDFSKDKSIKTFNKFCGRTCSGSFRAKIKHNL